MPGRVYKPKYTDKDGNRKEVNVWHIDYSINGKRHRESAKTEDKQEAETLLARRLADRGQVGIQRAAEQTAFADLCELIRNDYERNGRKSDTRLENSISHLETFFDGWSAAAIDEAAVEKYIARRLRDEKPHGGSYSPATINRELSALKRMLRLGYKQRLVRRMPDISLLKEDNARKGFFSEGQLRDVLSELTPELRPLVETAYITGWRKGELLSRDWRHVDFEESWLYLEPGESKSGEGRQFPLTERLHAILCKHRTTKVRMERKLGKIIQPLFFRYDGRYEGCRVRNFHKAWSQACEDAGHPERIFHDFRRTAVRNLVRAGVPEKVAMELTGHQTRSVFDRYSIVAEDMLRDAGEKLDAMQGGG